MLGNNSDDCLLWFHDSEQMEIGFQFVNIFVVKEPVYAINAEN